MRLFHDERLSKDGTVSCATCHDLSTGGDDGMPVSIGVGGQSGSFNSPTVFNSVLNFRQFWDGRAATLEAQAEGPLLAAVEMGWGNWDDAEAFLSGQSDLVDEFEELYSDGLTLENLLNALAVFESVLVTPDAPFDRWLWGEDDAISPEVLRGYELFKEVGCIACHQGRNIGANQFQIIGRVESTGIENQPNSPKGLYEVTGRERDRFRFKVPSLRNVELTSPYMHDGSIKTLGEAIQYMARHQLGEHLTPEEVDLLTLFLKSLTGELPEVLKR